MSYAATAALQAAVYQVLREDDALHALVGDAIYDAMPVAAPAGTYVSLGPEEVRDAGDMTAAGSQHDFVVSVLSGSDDANGFSAVKAAAVAVSDALETARIGLARGRLAGLWFLRAKARRAENGAGRRVDLTFRARIDLG
ncbi:MULTISPECIES: DUF3168 domain-containing protein [Paracoccus]|jgi:hypothetical protein|uniref:DUF3168 domain-containing protein n=2 Tax=Paracoccus TaxID=265 RepID=A0A2D2BVW9_9RHOB|nr:MULTISPECIES: DUF3168 domain-containing protein [Paracoccus]ATQ54408.1 DUF3168 domain-containing protein [Paracoccus yeei]AWX92543.1 DUF3168 domain-containing protein [Paracoccus mutanolyticus]AYF01734.1 Gene Transfer Agent associated protein [Paracoccus yeei]MBY0136565.1 DUF3168 domain-containing protein [Paracoccus yeei]OWJ94309.1 DUF3168 domain-containing protein [Paracoccus yeei]